MGSSSSDLANAMKLALDAVTEAKVPDDLREIAFSRALDVALGGKPASSGKSSEVKKPEAEAPDDSGQPTELAKVGRKLKLGTAELDRVFEQDGDEIHISAPRSAFDKSNTIGTRQVALLIAAARQAAKLDEDSTPVALIKEHCEEVGVADSNFSKHVKGITGTRLKGPNRQRAMKINSAGYEAAADLAAELASGEAA